MFQCSSAPAQALGFSDRLVSYAAEASAEAEGTGGAAEGCSLPRTASGFARHERFISVVVLARGAAGPQGLEDGQYFEA